MVKPIALARLAEAMHVDNGELISLVGGGGKTTTLFTLGEQLAGTTVLTTTTKMGAEQSSSYPVLIDPTDGELRTHLDEAGRALVWKAADERRAIGVDGRTCDRWFSIADNVVVEADGSRKRPFKAPADHEPVIPSKTTLLVACIGAGAFGQPLAESCHRPDLVQRKLTGHQRPSRRSGHDGESPPNKAAHRPECRPPLAGARKPASVRPAVTGRPDDDPGHREFI